MSTDGPVLWVVDEMMDDRALPTGKFSIAEAARMQSHPVLRTRFSSDGSEWMDALPTSSEIPVVCIGPHQGIEALMLSRGADWFPCAFHDVDELSYSRISEHHGDLMLNHDHHVMPWADFLERLPLDHPDGAFVRPDAVTKAFAGTVVHPGDLEPGSDRLYRFGKMAPDDLVVCATLRHIVGESRFVLADGEVVTGSTYRWDGKLDVRSDVPDLSLAFARTIADAPWQPDHVYVCDVAIVDAGRGWEARLVEMNPFSTSGLYACDTIKIVEQVGRTASRIHSQRPSTGPRR